MEETYIWQELSWSGQNTLESADFAPQLLMFVTAEKEREMFIVFFHYSFFQMLTP